MIHSDEETTDKKPKGKMPVTSKTKKDLDQLEFELEDARNAQLRAIADLQNFQRREMETKTTWVQDGVAGFLKNLLPRFLELKLGAEHSKDKDIQKAVVHFFAELEKQGVELFEPAPGDPIDPHTCEVLTVEEGHPGTVVRVLEPGWKYGDVILKPAKISGAQH